MNFVHIQAAYGTRKTAPAIKKVSYILRANEYSRDKKEVVGVGSGNMPSWGGRLGIDFWSAADAGERANGRLYRTLEFALPNDATKKEAHELVENFVRGVCGNDHPYTYALHSGKGTNLHCHLIFSERVNDRIDRDPATWFSRANSAEPAKGGAPKAQHMVTKEWLKGVREDWATVANQWLYEHGKAPDLDARSYSDRGLEQEPTVHVGYGLMAELRRQENEEIRAANKARVLLRLTEEEEKELLEARETIEEIGLYKPEKQEEKAQAEERKITPAYEVFKALTTVSQTAAEAALRVVETGRQDVAKEYIKWFNATLEDRVEGKCQRAIAAQKERDKKWAEVAREVRERREKYDQQNPFVAPKKAFMQSRSDYEHELRKAEEKWKNNRDREHQRIMREHPECGYMNEAKMAAYFRGEHLLRTGKYRPLDLERIRADARLSASLSPEIAALVERLAGRGQQQERPAARPPEREQPGRENDKNDRSGGR